MRQKMTPDEVEEYLVRVCRNRQRQGWTIVMRATYSETRKTCCVLAALDLDVCITRAARTRLGLGADAVYELLRGFDYFDGDVFVGSPLWVVGRRVALRVGAIPYYEITKGPSTEVKGPEGRNRVWVLRGINEVELNSFCHIKKGDLVKFERPGPKQLPGYRRAASDGFLSAPGLYFRLDPREIIKLENN